MLNLSSPGPLRRRIGLLAGIGFAVVLTSGVYAASAPIATPGDHLTDSADQYQLDVQLLFASDSAGHAQRWKLALCMAPDAVGKVDTGELRLAATPHGLPGHRVRVDLDVLTNAAAAPTHARVEGAMGQSLHASGAAVGGGQYTVELTPRRGCPVGAAGAPITARMQRVPARTAAETIARQAGFVLTNPEAFDQRAVSFHFERVPAERAMQLVARTDGLDATFDGRQVRLDHAR